MTKMKLSMVSLGCDKNAVDAELMLGDLKNAFDIYKEEYIDEADVVIVNTCGFIESAKQESIDKIIEVSGYKDGNLKMLIVAGCLSQRYSKELIDEMPEIDLLFGVNDYDKIREGINKFIDDGVRKIYLNTSKDILHEGERYIEEGTVSANVRISEGCNNRCTYCSIPSIRGAYRSRKIENIVEEVKFLSSKGIFEINLVAQDTTRYGIDLYGEKTLVKLIKEISKIEGIKWIRLFYAYPEEIEDDLIFEFRDNEKLVKYIDMPIQHISNNILKKMGRRGRKEGIVNILEKFKKEVKGMTIRTTFIIGFPSETEEDIEEIIEFVNMGYITWLGTFIFSREEGTKAYDMENQIDEEIASERQIRVMTAQQRITANKLKKYVTKDIDVLIENEIDGVYYGRCDFMAENVDGEVIVESEYELNIGEIYKVNVEDSVDYDLIGVVGNELSK